MRLILNQNIAVEFYITKHVARVTTQISFKKAVFV